MINNLDKEIGFNHDLVNDFFQNISFENDFPDLFEQAKEDIENMEKTHD